MLTIEIATQAINTRNGVSKRSGQPYTIHEQEAYLHQEGKPYPTPMKLNVESNEQGYPQPYSMGRYSLAGDSFYIDRYGSLAVKPRLIADGSKPESKKSN
tara:strand:+ start:80 stop:379 length:300 start_codon:yes stop_codon:yes gene_type:complete